jgi:hypothetical protein
MIKFITCVLSLTICPSLFADAQALRRGLPVLGTVQQECSQSFILDQVSALCDLLGADNCVSESVQCQTLTRQIFTGSGLGQTIPNNQQWNGMGGTGEPMADSLICGIRDLSPSLDGPIKSEVRIDLGLGTLRVVQEVGFVDFQRVNPWVKGYRKIFMKLPVVGKSDALTQSFTITKRKYSYVGNNRPTAGNIQIRDALNLNVKAEGKFRQININPPKFPVVTPIGTFDVQPLFSYSTFAGIIQAPYAQNNLLTDLPDFLGRRTHRVRFWSVFGSDIGIDHSGKVVRFANHIDMRSGWSSQMGLGTRAALKDTPIWQPGSGQVSRPELDFTVPRNSLEGVPSINVNAAAKVRYPRSPAEVLPEWVFDLPGLRPIVAYITVAPTIEAGVGGQFNIGASEGSSHWQTNEFRFTSDRAANSMLWSGLHAAGQFRIDVGLRLKVEVRLPTPFGLQNFAIIDVDKVIPIPITGNVKSGATHTAGGFSKGPTNELAFIKTFRRNHGTPAAAKNYLASCYADNPIPANEPQNSPTAEGDPEKLFANDKIIWPCNICIHTRRVNYSGGTIPTKIEWLQESVQGDTNIKCDGPSKTGCMDLCRMSPSGELILARRAGQIATGLAHGHPERGFYGACEQRIPQ